MTGLQLTELIYQLGQDAMKARQRYAADLAHHTLDVRAFDIAVEAFDEERHRLLPEPAFRDGHAYHDAEIAALEKFIGVYLTEAGQ